MSGNSPGRNKTRRDFLHSIGGGITTAAFILGQKHLGDNMRAGDAARNLAYPLMIGTLDARKEDDPLSVTLRDARLAQIHEEVQNINTANNNLAADIGVGFVGVVTGVVGSVMGNDDNDRFSRRRRNQGKPPGDDTKSR